MGKTISEPEYFCRNYTITESRPQSLLSKKSVFQNSYNIPLSPLNPITWERSPAFVFLTPALWKIKSAPKPAITVQNFRHLFSRIPAPIIQPNPIRRKTSNSRSTNRFLPIVRGTVLSILRLIVLISMIKLRQPQVTVYSMAQSIATLSPDIEGGQHILRILCQYGNSAAGGIPTGACISNSRTTFSSESAISFSAVSINSRPMTPCGCEDDRSIDYGLHHICRGLSAPLRSISLKQFIAIMPSSPTDRTN